MSEMKYEEYHALINGIEVSATYPREAVQNIFLPLLRDLTKLKTEKNGRILAMLAAPPGAGKTTLAMFLQELSVREEGIASIQAIGMDGFHHRQDYLLTHTVMRDGKEVRMVDIKGAPVTFDLDGLTEKIRRVASGEVCGWPIYDRTLHNPVDDAVIVNSDIVLLEGNYLLLKEEGWDKISSFADYTIFLEADRELLRKRLIDRRIKTGVPREKAEAFVDFSDMRNVETVLEHSKKADYLLDKNCNDL